MDPVPSREQVPLDPPCEPLTGDSHGHLLAPLGVFAESLGYSVSFEPIDGSAGGFCDMKGKRIVVDAALPANGKLRALIHETAHALGVDYERYSRSQAEVILDTVTFVAASSVGLAVGGESIPYVAGWGRGRRARGDHRIRRDDRRARAPHRGRARRSGPRARAGRERGVSARARPAARGHAPALTPYWNHAKAR